MLMFFAIKWFFNKLSIKFKKGVEFLHKYCCISEVSTVQNSINFTEMKSSSDVKAFFFDSAIF